MTLEAWSTLEFLVKVLWHFPLDTLTDFTGRLSIIFSIDARGKKVCNIQCNVGYQAFQSGMMGRYNYKMPMEFLEKDTVLTL